MTQLFAEDGAVTGVTVVEAGPCVVAQVRSQEVDGYDAVQLGYDPIRDKLTAKPQRGHFNKAGIANQRFLREERLSAPAEVSPGDVIKCDVFSEG
ncbi:MAG: 50S ribosomal protein L3, partial [Planctomycetota bacterium]